MSVDLPDYRGRVAVLQVHGRNKPMASDVDISAVARLTPGFSGQCFTMVENKYRREKWMEERAPNFYYFMLTTGAELQNLLNEVGKSLHLCGKERGCCCIRFSRYASRRALLMYRTLHMYQIKPIFM